MQPYNWNQFVLRVPVNANTKSIYDAWTTTEGIESWFLRKAVYTSPANRVRSELEPVQPGDKYVWLWHGYDDTFAEKGKIIACNEEDFFQFEFSGGCIVTVNVKSEQGENICELVQDMTPPDEKDKQFFFIECQKGWTFYLTNLKSVLETGYDLRNKNVDIPKVVTA
ncbi:MAG: hypothetical protein C5B52_10915 [Bacteroidetes bacterium]|nr:MAG: hypothetical protein C5B52_10915 [Bacteroidota bacterium]